MFNPATITPEAIRRAANNPAPQESAANVFRVLHGFYGNLFLSKFATGDVGPEGDRGVLGARQIWAYGLREFDAATVKAALAQCMERHPEFPPSLPQFVALCRASKPREAFDHGQPRIGMSQELRSQYAAEARAIIEKHTIKAATLATGNKELPAGLDGLKQAIAHAVACAGGDEVRTLHRLDRELAPRRPA